MCGRWMASVRIGDGCVVGGWMPSFWIGEGCFVGEWVVWIGNGCVLEVDVWFADR